MKAKTAIAALLIAFTAGTALAQDHKNWIGRWVSDWNGTINTSMTIRSVNNAGEATLTYRWEAAPAFNTPAGSIDQTGRIRGDTLTFGNQTRFTMKMQSNGTLSASRSAGGRGIFRKQ
ncbi:MAG: hypothetical protein ACRED5_22525 [Propylenella sp.]